MVHHQVQQKINAKSEHALRALLFRLWMISTGKTRKRIERMLAVKRGQGHPQRRKSKKSKSKKSRRKMTKAEARARFKKLLPKINAGRRKKGLKPIHFK